MIYDRRTAVVQADPENLQAGTLLIRGGNVVKSLAAIYDYCWTTASEPDEVPRSAEGGPLTDQQRAVLRMLAAGAKDSAIARSMGVSTRIRPAGRPPPQVPPDAGHRTLDAGTKSVPRWVSLTMLAFLVVDFALRNAGPVTLAAIVMSRHRRPRARPAVTQAGPHE